MSEEVKPVAWAVRCKVGCPTLEALGGTIGLRRSLHLSKPDFSNGWNEDDFIVEPLYLAPAPDKLALAVEALELLLPYTDDLQDAGPPGYGWKSDGLSSALSNANLALAALKAAD